MSNANNVIFFEVRIAGEDLMVARYRQVIDGEVATVYVFERSGATVVVDSGITFDEELQQLISAPTAWATARSQRAQEVKA